MRGSILVTFDELINDRGIDSFELEVNNVIRDMHFTDSNNLYSTYAFIDDDVIFSINHTTDVVGEISVKRIDYTTDDEGGDLGIKETIINPYITSGDTFYTIEFTVETVPSAYNFKYVIDGLTKPKPTPTPTPTPTPPPCDYYKIYNNAVINRPYGPVQIYTYVQCDGNLGNRTISLSGSGTVSISGLTYFECVSGGTVPVTLSNFTAELIPGACPTPTPSPTPAPANITLEYVYNYNNLTESSNVSGTTVFTQDISTVPVLIFNATDLIGSGSFSGSTVVDNSFYLSGLWNIAGRRTICHQTIGDLQITGVTADLYINNVLQNSYAPGVPFNDTYTVDNCPSLCSRCNQTGPSVGGITIAQNDVIRIVWNDRFSDVVPPTPTPTPTATSTPTPTPTATSTPTPTPTPTVTPTPAPATIRYRYIGTSTISGTTKTTNDLLIRINSNNVHTGTTVNFTTSTDTTSAATTIDSSYVGTPVDIQGTRRIRRNTSGGVLEYVTTHYVRLYRNGLLVTGNTDTTNYNVPVSPSSLVNSFTFTGVTINTGDLIEVRWGDTIII